MQSGDPERPESPAAAPASPPPPRPAWPPPGWDATPPPPPGWGVAGAIPGWNAGAARPPVGGFGRFRPMGIGELLDASFALYRRNLLLLMAVTAVVQVPFAALNFAAGQLLGVGHELGSAAERGPFGTLGSPGATLTDAQTAALKALIAYSVLVLAVQMFVVLPLSLAAMSRAVSDRYLDRPATVGSSYAAAARRGGALLGAILLLILAVVGLSLAMVVGVATPSLLGPVGVVIAIPAFLGYLVSLPLLAVRCTLFAQVVVVEGAGSLTGLRRSWRLTRGCFWRTCAILLVVLILQSVVGAVIQIPAGLLVSGAGEAVRQLVGQALGAIASVVVSPLSLIALTLVYYDLRIRKEAFDIEMLAASL